MAREQVKVSPRSSRRPSPSQSRDKGVGNLGSARGSRAVTPLQALVGSGGHGSRSPSLSLVLDEMQREQAHDKRRVIIGSVLTLGSVLVVLVVLIMRLLSPSPHSPPTTLSAKSFRKAPPGSAEGLNASILGAGRDGVDDGWWDFGRRAGHHTSRYQLGGARDTAVVDRKLAPPDASAPES